MILTPHNSANLLKMNLVWQRILVQQYELSDPMPDKNPWGAKSSDMGYIGPEPHPLTSALCILKFSSEKLE